MVRIGPSAANGIAVGAGVVMGLCSDRTLRTRLSSSQVPAAAAWLIAAAAIYPLARARRGRVPSGILAREWAAVAGTVSYSRPRIACPRDARVV
jgi:hypothetical protein